MHCRIVTYLTVLATVFAEADAGLSNAPQDTESKIGDTTYFNCSTNLTSKEILWNHGDQYVYSEDGILPPYDERFEIDRNESIGSYNLVIHSVEASDAGEYICIDDDGHGIRRSAQLIVLEDDPDCQSNIQTDGVIGQNVFNIPPDEIQLTCNVTYHGSIPPQMEWRKVGDTSSTKLNVTSQLTSDNRLTHMLNLKGDISLDKLSYVCQTKRSMQKQYTCISKVIKVLYVISGKMTELNVFRGDEITCIDSNNTFPCTREWHHVNYTCPLSCAETITTHLLGVYLCKTKCNVRGTEYAFNNLKAVVAEAPVSPSPSASAGTIAASVAIAMVVIIALVVFIAVLTTRKSKQQRVLRMRMIQQAEEKFKEEYKQKGTTGKENEKEIKEIEIKISYQIPCKVPEEGNIKEKKILGVAILGETMFLVFKKSRDVEMHDCKKFNLPYTRPKVITMKDLVAPLDICSSKEPKCLYIMDTNDHNFEVKGKFEERKVFKINTDGHILKKWSTKNDACGFISANKEGNVIITVQDGHMLLEYTSAGKLVRSIDLLACFRPWHAIKLDDAHYIVSHGTYGHLHRVCLVDKTGHVDKAFGDERGSTATQFHIPYHLAVGSSGYVFVADLCNNRVLLLDKELQFEANLVPKYKQRFKSPRRICLNEELGILVVVIGAGVPQEIINEETSDFKDDKGPVNSDYPMSSILGEAHDSVQKTEKDTMSKEIDDSVEIINAQAKHQLEEKRETDKLLEPDDLPKTTMQENGVLKRIEKDCRLLVFDIKPLMDNYFS